MDKQQNDFVGVVENMPGTNGGFTMAAFNAESVPAGSKLYLAPQEKVDTADFYEWYERRYGKVNVAHAWERAQRDDAREIWNASRAANPSPTWKTGVPDIPSRTVKEFTVAVHRQGIPGLPYVFSAFYSNELQISSDGDFLPKGWYIKNTGSRYYSLLGDGDVLRGWMELPEYAE